VPAVLSLPLPRNFPQTLTPRSSERMFCGGGVLPMMDEMTIRVAIRTTARISFVLFLGAFLGHALCRFYPAVITRWLKENKGAFTLGFAGSHTAHLAFILALVAALGRQHLLNELGWIVVVAFVTGFLLIYALAADVLLRHRTFWSSSRFETLAHYYLMILFVVGFTLSGIARPLFYVPFILVAFAALGVRIAVAIRSRKQQVLGANA
jgi:methionine sulfoxide reductase heme-binding subunit